MFCLHEGYDGEWYFTNLNPAPFQPPITRSIHARPASLEHFPDSIPAIPCISSRITKRTVLLEVGPACMVQFGLTIPEPRDSLDGQREPEVVSGLPGAIQLVEGGSGEREGGHPV